MEESGRKQADPEYRASSWYCRIPRKVLRGVFPRRDRDLTTASGRVFSAKHVDHPGVAIFLSQVQEVRLLFQRHRFFCCFTISFLSSQGKPVTGWSLSIGRKGRQSYRPPRFPISRTSTDRSKRRATGLGWESARAEVQISSDSLRE